MSSASPQVIGQKSAIDESTLPNSVIGFEATNMFIDKVVDESVLLKNIRVFRTGKTRGTINKLDLPSIVTEGASSRSKPTTRVPTESVVAYDCVKYRTAFDLTSDFEEDNLEGQTIQEKIFNMFVKGVANDQEYAAIESDDSLDTGDAESDANNLLGVNDGFNKMLLAQVPSAQQIDANGASSSIDLYQEMLDAIPAKYRINKPAYKFFLPSSAADKWRRFWVSRITTGGDNVLANGMIPGILGMPWLEIPRFPEDLAVGTTDTDGSMIWLTPPQNLIWVIRRELTREYQRQPRGDRWEATMHYRCDFLIEEPDMVILAKNISQAGTEYDS